MADGSSQPDENPHQVICIKTSTILKTPGIKKYIRRSQSVVAQCSYWLQGSLRLHGA